MKKKNKKYEKNHEEIMLSCIMLLKMSACRRNFDETKYMFVFFLIKDNEMPEKYNEIWGKVSKDIKKDLIVSLYTIKIFKN